MNSLKHIKDVSKEIFFQVDRQKNGQKHILLQEEEGVAIRRTKLPNFFFLFHNDELFFRFMVLWFFCFFNGMYFKTLEGLRMIFGSFELQSEIFLLKTTTYLFPGFSDARFPMLEASPRSVATFTLVNTW